MPAIVSTQVRTPASGSGLASGLASASNPELAKKKSRPLPKILTMPPRTGDFSIVDDAGNFHGLKRGRSSPASVAKFMKKAPTVATNKGGGASQSSQAPVRRSPRNLKNKEMVLKGRVRQLQTPRELRAKKICSKGGDLGFFV
ncbi:hypothetical protein COLO4_22887 [Corchorus olitorius]|uniref:Uncharacterized protein n=1 Tax=Corchorus olitorius TaxID=93759 RepID=A0A1R3IJE7_9ROSI|nr:hypothetical protein COLO4_22887 [Corchorus olitorius]